MDDQQIIVGCVEEIILQRDEYQDMLLEVRTLARRATSNEMRRYAEASIEYFQEVLRAIDHLKEQLVIGCEEIEDSGETIYLFDKNKNTIKH